MQRARCLPSLPRSVYSTLQKKTTKKGRSFAGIRILVYVECYLCWLRDFRRLFVRSPVCTGCFRKKSGNIPTANHVHNTPTTILATKHNRTSPTE
jgi:hypothetical protein